MGNSIDYTKIIIALMLCVTVLFVLFIVLGVKLYNALRENAVLESQIASIVADNSQEKTFKVIDDDLQKIIKILGKCQNCKLKDI